MRIGQQDCVSRALKTTDMCYIREIRIQESNSAILMTSSHFVKFYLPLLGDPKAAGSAVAGAGVTLSGRDEAVAE